jgi:hypothetical protein
VDLIENPEVAKYVSQFFLDLNGQLDESIVTVEKGISPAEYKAYKRAIGYVMYEVFDKILEPLYLRHPSLKPPDWDDDPKTSGT